MSSPGRLFPRSSCPRWSQPGGSTAVLSALAVRGREAGQRLYEHLPWLLESAPDNHLTIAHGDFRVDNLFFDFDNPDDPVIVFHWQATMMYRGVSDLSYFLGGSITRELRREIEENTAKLYHQRLLDRGVSGYSFDECWTDYLLGTLFYAHIPVLAFSSLGMSDERGRELARVLTQRHFATIVDNAATSLLP